VGAEGGSRGADREASRFAVVENDILKMIYISKRISSRWTMQVSKWGNSLAVRLPKKLVESLGLKEGDDLNIVSACDGVLEVETEADRRRRALSRMKARNWVVPAGFRFDRDEANER
jgi:antitoxin MazE